MFWAMNTRQYSLTKTPGKRYKKGSLVSRVRVSGGHLCEAEAPTEAAAETLAKPQVLTEGL